MITAFASLEGSPSDSQVIPLPVNPSIVISVIEVFIASQISDTLISGAVSYTHLSLFTHIPLYFSSAEKVSQSFWGFLFSYTNIFFSKVQIKFYKKQSRQAPLPLNLYRTHPTDVYKRQFISRYLWFTDFNSTVIFCSWSVASARPKPVILFIIVFTLFLCLINCI